MSKAEDERKMRPIVIITCKTKFKGQAVLQYYLDTNELVKLGIYIPGHLVKPLEAKSKLYIISDDSFGWVKQNDDFTCVYEQLTKIRSLEYVITKTIFCLLVDAMSALSSCSLLSSCFFV